MLWQISATIAMAVAGAVSAAPAADKDPARDPVASLQQGYTLLSRRPPDRPGAREAFAVTANAGTPEQSCEAHYKLAEMDEQDLALAAALGHYRAAVARAPSSRYAARSQPRIEYLSAHAEGDFAPLTAFERARRDPQTGKTRASIDAIAHEISGFPPGLVRSEGWLYTAQLYRQLGLKEESLAELRKLASDPTADSASVQEASRNLFDAVASAGDLNAAVEEAEKAREVDPTVRAQYRVLAKRARTHRIALAWLAILTLCAGVAIGRAVVDRRADAVARATSRFVPWVVLFTGWLAAAGGALASAYEAGNAGPFLWLAAGLAPVALLTRAWSAASPPSLGSRTLRTVLALGGIVAVAYLALEHVDVTYLESFGL